jgi:hypothetical protein
LEDISLLHLPFTALRYGRSIGFTAAPTVSSADLTAIFGDTGMDSGMGGGPTVRDGAVSTITVINIEIYAHSKRVSMDGI